MEFVNGRIEEDISMLQYTPEERKATYESMCEVMAALHKVDYVAVGLEEFGRPSGYIQRQLKTWGNMYAGGEEYVRDPQAWEAVGLEFFDNGDAMCDPQRRASLFATLPTHRCGTQGAAAGVPQR